jgi:hypothetical protein
MHGPEQIKSPPQLTPSSIRVSPFDPLKDAVESLVGGKLQNQETSSLIEDFLNSHAARPELVTAARELCSMLTSKGLNVALQYCKSEEHKHPLPIIVAQTSNGEYVLPNINTFWNPAAPLERGADMGDSKRKHVIAPDGVDESETPNHGQLRLELFSSTSPVCVALYPSSSVDSPAEAQPIFSDKAFSEALHHAASAVISGQSENFSVILEETIVPEIRNRLRSLSALCGEREVPEICDIGTRPDGSAFLVETHVSLRDEACPLQVNLAVKRRDGHIVCDELEAKRPA